VSRIVEMISVWRLQPRRVLALAVIASALVHLALTQWPVPPPGEIESPPPLVATITELPPPPPPVATRPSAKPKRRAAVAIAPAATAPVIPDILPAPSADVEPTPPMDPAPVVAELPFDEPAVTVPIVSAPPPKQLPPRIDLAYRAFLGTRGFFIGEGVYRLEHQANQYKISTVAEARGLAALLFHGQALARSEGAITSAGLQPNTYSIERTSNHRRESATFDWETGMVLLNDDKSSPLEMPTFDPLVVLWQFYFAPPEQNETQFNIATTRRIYHYSFRRIATETLTLPFGEIETQVWRRQGGDGSIDAQVWLAPSLHFVAVKVRLSNDRATVEALLDSIRVDDTVAQQ
jgi:hypothetical protein